MLLRQLLGVFHSDVECGDDGESAPEGQRQFVGVQEIVEAAVNEIGNQGKCHHQTQYLVGPVGGMVIGTDARVQTAEEQRKDSEHSGDAGFGAGANIFAMGVASVSEVRGDNCSISAFLERCILKLVSAWTPTDYGTFAYHAESRNPAV